MKAGETKTVDVKFPENYQAKELAGKTAQFEIYCRKVLSEIKSPVAEKAAAIQKERAAKKAAEQAAAAQAQKDQESTPVEA
jgi:trigger factor